ncbi:MAG: hypothetical protein OHK0053_27610 [Microscillaceae bacterium]
MLNLPEGAFYNSGNEHRLGSRAFTMYSGTWEPAAGAFATNAWAVIDKDDKDAIRVEYMSIVILLFRVCLKRKMSYRQTQEKLNQHGL